MEVAGAPLRSGSKLQRKPLKSLKVLGALGGESVAAEQIAKSLWPDAEADHAYSALTTTLGPLHYHLAPADRAGPDVMRYSPATFLRLAKSRVAC